MFLSLVPMLHTQNMTATITFYESVLGFSVAGRAGDEWCRLERDGAAVMFFQIDEFDEPHATATQYIYVDDLDAFWASIKGDVQAEWGPMEMPYGMYEVGIRDVNGYLLSFGEVM